MEHFLKRPLAALPHAIRAGEPPGGIMLHCIKSGHCFAGLTAFLAMTVSGCATTAPQELTRARAAYEEVAQGQASELAPTAVDDARVALARAERAFDEHGVSAETIEKANFALGEAARARRIADQRADDQAELTRLLDSERPREIAGVAAQPAGAPPRVEAEREGAFTAALARLDGVMAVQENEDGVMITLPSGTFASGSADLGPTAPSKLARIADALRAVPDRPVRVEGYTDSVGDKEANVALSARRADAIGAWLTAHGISRERLTLVGRGATDPIASNDTPEGRARNRRVQLVVGAPTHAATPSSDGDAAPLLPPPGE